MNARFVHPWVLLLLWLVPAFAAWAWVAHRTQRRRLGDFVSAVMQTKLFPGDTSVRFAWQLACAALASLLFVVALARPQWGSREEVVYGRGRDLIIALDVSRSMLANDVHPNRLARAKADILDLIAELRGDRAALLAFRFKGSLLCPLTTDYAYLRQALESAGPNSAPRGETDIGDAIRKAMEAFESDPGAHKAIILISDGEDLTGKALDAAKAAAERGIPIFTVGIGDRRGSGVPDPEHEGSALQYKGEKVVTRLTDDTLMAIANVTKGAYVPMGISGIGRTTLGTLYAEHLRKITAKDLEETRQRRYIERYQWFLLPGLVLALATAFLSRGRLRATAPRSAAPPPLPGSVHAAPPHAPPRPKVGNPPGQEVSNA